MVFPPSNLPIVNGTLNIARNKIHQRPIDIRLGRKGSGDEISEKVVSNYGTKYICPNIKRTKMGGYHSDANRVSTVGSNPLDGKVPFPPLIY